MERQAKDHKIPGKVDNQKFKGETSLGVFQKVTEKEEIQDPSQRKKTVVEQQKLEYALEELCGRLDLPLQKKREAMQLHTRIDDQDLDEISLAGALLFVASRKTPSNPRWRKLVARECHRLSQEDNSLYKRYSGLYWQDSLKQGVDRIRESTIEVPPVTTLDYTSYIFSLLQVEESLKVFTVRNLYLLLSKSENGQGTWCSKSPVALTGALVHLGSRLFSDVDEVGCDVLNRCLALDENTFKDLAEKLETEVTK